MAARRSGLERGAPTRMSDETSDHSVGRTAIGDDCYVGAYFSEGRGISGIGMSIVKHSDAVMVSYLISWKHLHWILRGIGTIDGEA